MTVTEFLKSHVPFLSGITEEEAHEMAAAAAQMAYDKHQTIFMQGETIDALHVVALGKVSVVVKQKGKDPVVVAQLGPGAVFGEVSILEEGVAGATVRAAEEAFVFVIPQDVFRGILDRNGGVKERILAEIAARKAAAAAPKKD